MLIDYDGFSFFKLFFDSSHSTGQFEVDFLQTEIGNYPITTQHPTAAWNYWRAEGNVLTTDYLFEIIDNKANNLRDSIINNYIRWKNFGIDNVSFDGS